MSTNEIKTQKDWVRNRLNTYGFVTRNQALAFYITRLGAIIADLKLEGMEITGNYVDLGTTGMWGGPSKDYKYKLVKKDS